jgi:serine/threonine protein kinase
MVLVTKVHKPVSNRSSQQVRLRPTLVDDTILFSGDKLCIPTHRPIRILGQGKNGFVVLCHNEFLNRPEALKVWAKLDPDDTRDKFKQGLEEARKAVAASQGRFVAQTYAAGVLLERYLYATMEYVPGPTLHDYLADHRGDKDNNYLAAQYLRALSDTGGVLHGDAHTKNVIVQEKGWLMLLDFGTSHYTGSGKFVERHWRVVGETIRRIFRNSQRYIAAKKIVGKVPVSKASDSDSRQLYYHLLISWTYPPDPLEETDN